MKPTTKQIKRVLVRCGVTVYRCATIRGLAFIDVAPKDRDCVEWFLKDNNLLHVSGKVLCLNGSESICFPNINLSKAINWD
tara:strand:- start:615 stop:857 length:243 start_codon:yes stop_codon:yes gene_type:complete